MGKKEKLTLDKTHEALCREWHPKNKLRPSDVTAGVDKKVWWILPYHDPKTGKDFVFEWEALVKNRARGQGCPFLNTGSGAKAWKGFNDLASTHENVAKEWDYERNDPNITPETVTAGSSLSVWWILPYEDPVTKKNFVFRWKTRIQTRARGAGCPYLNGKLFTGFNDLASTHEHLVGIWNFDKNGNLTPDKVTAGMNKKVWWILPYKDPDTGKEFVFEWFTGIDSMASNGGQCPYLSKLNPSVWTGFNSLLDTHKDIAETWDFDKNGSLRPEHVTAGSSKKVWWKMTHIDPRANKEYVLEWNQTVKGRTSGRGCPYLTTRLLPGLNDLESKFPSIALQWHPTKNTLTPRDVMPGTSLKVWWIAEYEGEIHEWYMSVNERTTHGRSCPGLSSSNLEKAVGKMLKDKCVEFRKEASFKDLRSKQNGTCKYDFYSEPLDVLIECDGKQHFHPVEFFGGKEYFEIRKSNDNTKSQYAFSHNIPLLRIPYIYDPIKDAYKIEELVLNFIKTKTIPQEIINFYAQFEFSDYAKLATDYQNGSKDEVAA